MKFGIDKLGIDKLGIDMLRDPTRVLEAWKNLASRTFGRQLFSRAVGLMAPYTGTIAPQVVELAPGYARVQMRDRWGVRNHLKSVHAVALMNLGEAATGLATMSLVPPGGRGIVRELGMEYLKKARGTITAEARVELPTSAGTHDVEVQGELRNSIGEVVARVRARWRLDIPAEAKLGRGEAAANSGATSAANGGAASAATQIDPEAVAAGGAAISGRDVTDEGAPAGVSLLAGARDDVPDEGDAADRVGVPTQRSEIADEGPAGQRVDITIGRDDDASEDAPRADPEALPTQRSEIADEGPAGQRVDLVDELADDLDADRVGAPPIGFAPAQDDADPTGGERTP